MSQGDATTIAGTGATINYCAIHSQWIAPNTHCWHCATAALIHELRDQIRTLESRIADLEQQRDVADLPRS